MQHFRLDKPLTYLTPLPLFRYNHVVDTRPYDTAPVDYEPVTNMQHHKSPRIRPTPACPSFKRRDAINSGRYHINSTDETVPPVYTFPEYSAIRSSPFAPASLKQFLQPLCNIMSATKRPEASSLSNPVNTAAYQPVSTPAPLHSATASQDVSAAMSSNRTTARFYGMFSHHATAPPIAVTGTLAALHKLDAALKSGIVLRHHEFPSAASAFEQSLQPLQTAHVFPTTAQMQTLFQASQTGQQGVLTAAAFDPTRDFSNTPRESAGHQIWPPVGALREIDCAQKYLAIGARRRGDGSVVDMVIVTLDDNREYRVHHLPSTSGQPGTHSVLMFRQLKPLGGRDFDEVWHPSFISSAPAPTTSSLTSPIPSTLAPPSTPTAPNAIHTHPAPSNNPDPLQGITDEKDVDNDLILRAAQLYTNTELYNTLRAMGSTSGYNAVTKRITNSLRRRAKAEGREYRVLRSVWNRERRENVAAAVGGRRWGGRVSRGRRGGAGSDREGFGVGGEMEGAGEGDVEMLDVGEGEGRTTTTTGDGDLNAVEDYPQQDRRSYVPLRRSARVRRKAVVTAREDISLGRDGGDDDGDDADGGDDDEQGFFEADGDETSDGSDISEFEEEI